MTKKGTSTRARAAGWLVGLVALLAAPPLRADPVVWTALVNSTASGNTLQKTSGCDGCEDAGAVSSQTIGSAGGSVEFTASQITTTRVVGLSRGNANTTRADIDFGIQLWAGGAAEVRENGVYRAETSYTIGDVFRIAVASGVVTYSKNGQQIYRSTASPSFPLLVDTCLYSLNAAVANAVISGASGGSGGDTTRPTVSITSPANGSTVSGTVTVKASASDDVGVVGVQFFVDGTKLGAEDVSAPYSAAWDTTQTTDGPHTLTAVARDAAGNSEMSSPVAVTVGNGGGGGATGGRVEEDDPSIVYVVASTWYYRFSPGYSGGRVNASPHAGQRATLTFTGSGVDWIGYRATNTGIARVYLDGTLVAEVDTWAPVPVFQPPLYSVRGLARAVHTLAVEVTGTYSTPTGSAWIAVDAFDITP